LLLYYITDRAQFAGEEKARWGRLLEKIQEAGAAGVDFIQLREKDLSGRKLEKLSREALQVLANTSTRLLINSRSDIALACGAHGVHLRSEDVSVADARRIAAAASNWLVFVSCHSEEDLAHAQGADFAVFGPVFQKRGAQPAGIAKLRAACQHGLPVIALGGVTVTNARYCVEAGAAGVAGIRLFQENAVADVVKLLRG
jgi:thiamine-phosphate pyrophosphorylase